MLASVSDGYDKSEGSFFWDLLAPIAIEIEKLKLENEETLHQSFVQFASSDYLTMRCAEINIIRKSASYAEGTVFFSGTQGTNIPAGTIISSETVYFQTLNNFSIDNVSETQIICTELGSKGNLPSASIKNMPISIAGVTSVTNNTQTTGGFDEETDDELRTRFIDAMSNIATSGNENHYKQWATEISEVTNAKAEACWNGNGTVRVIICTIDGPANADVITKTINYLESKRPVGADVTVVSVIEKSISITATLTATSDLTIIKNTFIEKLTSYFDDISMSQDYISIAQVGSLLIEIDGVFDYSNLKINNTSSNLLLNSTEIPILSEVIFA